MKIVRKPLPAVLLIVYLSLAACSQLEQPPEVIRHYVLEYAPPQVAEKRPLPVSLQVAPFQPAAVYTSNRMIYRQADFRREAYVYRQWRIPPADMLTDLFVRDLRHSHLFLAVAAPGQHFPVTHVVCGTLNRFMEQDPGKHPHAVLSVTLTLTSAHPAAATPGILLQRSYTFRQRISEPPPLGLARAMSLAAAKFSAAAIRDIYSALARSAAAVH